MITFQNKEALYAEFKARFMKEIDDRKPLSTKDLEFAFIANDGKKYYHFTNHELMPIERFAVKKKLLSWMAISLDSNEFDSLIETGKAALNEGLKTGKGAAKIGFILTEMEARRGKMVVHTELLYQFIALHYVREDELADTYSDIIQMEKVEVFKKEVAEKGSSFFLTKKELKTLYDMTDWSEHEWTAYWHESLIQQKALKIHLDKMKKESMTA